MSKISNEKIVETLVKCGGSISKTAGVLDVSKTYLDKRILKTKKLRDKIAEIKDGWVELAVQEVKAAVARHEPWAIKFMVENAELINSLSSSNNSNTTHKVQKKTKKKSVTYSDDQLINALKKIHGNVSEAAKFLGCSRRVFYDRFDKEPERWQEIRNKIREEQTDFVENVLMKNIKAGATAETLFYLKCQGKKRGYVESQEIKLSRSRDARLNREITEETSEVEASKLYADMIRESNKNE